MKMEKSAFWGPGQFYDLFSLGKKEHFRRPLAGVYNAPDKEKEGPERRF